MTKVKGILTEEKLYYLYQTKGFSDRDISEMYNISRGHVNNLRRMYGIPSRAEKSTGRLGEIKVIEHLIEMFGEENVLDMNETDKKHPYDILLFGETRIEVKSSKQSDRGYFCFSFSNSEELGVDTDNPYVYVTHTGRTVKNLDYTCDYLCLVFIEDGYTFSFVPTNQGFDFYKKSTSSIKLENHPRELLNNWDILTG